jgi:hypothetical protein
MKSQLPGLLLSLLLTAPTVPTLLTAPADPLPYTRPLDWSEADLSARLMDGAHRDWRLVPASRARAG